ncbi:MAG TPA: phosphodiester glycosidase family protein [Bauldia sp.]|nr:phosphodiester glycosidase family protein [Bauldia sp.]
MKWLTLPLLLAIALPAIAAEAPGTAPAAEPPKLGPDFVTEPDFALLLDAAGSAHARTLAGGAKRRSAELPEFGMKLDAWIFDRAAYTLRIARTASPTGSTIAELIGNGVFAIDGGYFERDKKTKVVEASGLLVIDGKEVAPENDRAGSGLVYAGRDGVGIGYRKALADRSGMAYAVQVGPVLVEPGGIVGIANRKNVRDNRSALCLTRQSIVAVAVTGGISLYQLARLLAADPAKGGFGCEVAINLDGGPSTQAMFRGDKTPSVPGGSPIHNAIVIVPASK